MNRFQQSLRDRIDAALSKYGLTEGRWVANPGATDTYYKEVMISGELHTIALFPDWLNMTTPSKGLFEVFLKYELKDPEAIGDAFLRRLDGYLKDGDWDNH